MQKLLCQTLILKKNACQGVATGEESDIESLKSREEKVDSLYEKSLPFATENLLQAIPRLYLLSIHDKWNLWTHGIWWSTLGFFQGDVQGFEYNSRRETFRALPDHLGSPSTTQLYWPEHQRSACVWSKSQVSCYQEYRWGTWLKNEISQASFLI